MTGLWVSGRKLKSAVVHTYFVWNPEGDWLQRLEFRSKEFPDDFPSYAGDGYDLIGRFMKVDGFKIATGHPMDAISWQD
ncbi:MAG: hypothetical protein AAFZ49_13445 [Cyanobacteria bacterium J06659_2]